MKSKSILLPLSGSKQSRQATEVCWALARRIGASITAHHVIDTHSAWEFLGQDNPGFLSSELYLDSYQDLVNSLFCLGESLAEGYANEAKVRHIDDVCLLDEGEIISEICKRASNHKMVVIGHKPAKSQSLRRQFQRLSVAESLAHDCPRPLLVVQSVCAEWTSLSIMLSLDHINTVYIDSCLDMADALGLPPVLVCLTGGAHEESAEDFAHNMRISHPRLHAVPLVLAPAQKDIAVHVEHWYGPVGQSFDRAIFDNTLIVIPTRMVAGQRLTVVDSSPSLFVRYLALPSILLWPEEYVFSGILSEEANTRELVTAV